MHTHFLFLNHVILNEGCTGSSEQHQYVCCFSSVRLRVIQSVAVSVTWNLKFRSSSCILILIHNLFWQNGCKSCFIVIGIHIKENSFVANMCDWLYHVYEHSCVGPAACIVGWNTWEMTTGTSPICLSLACQELMQENATSRKLMHSPQKNEGWQIGKS